MQSPGHDPPGLRVCSPGPQNQEHCPTMSTKVAAAASLPDFQKSTSQNLKFEREDWALFRTLEGLEQKSGVPKNKLIRLVMKELADNALDEGGQVSVGPLPTGGYFVEDSGRGNRRQPHRSRTAVQHLAPTRLHQTSAVADQRRARKRLARCRGCCAGVRRRADRDHS